MYIYIYIHIDRCPVTPIQSSLLPAGAGLHRRYRGALRRATYGGVRALTEFRAITALTRGSRHRVIARHREASRVNPE